ncbi:copper chaperone PCu(A)C [Reyranella sp. MMS21-HV4-11]|uniref:Copper chaperone PCu(A)C n=1 Tax=Reyranella humidisoli TaxID=2849149 RepID=A0ABS6INC3_9HYPH|nr:copper chaperone PCu(A)C [Reyranella sp. MMS21-HV4-11]MBU8876101.1 copper chaperone PCu(A)C [Reyranella sp. MMS21-HV4-11]
MLARRLFLVTAVSLLAVPSMAQDYKLGSLEITTPWTRATAPTARTGGGFMTITNKGTTADRLVSARSTASEKVEIHEMQMDGSVMRMRELAKGLDIPPGATVMLKPGSYHIMFMELKAPLAKDAKVPVTLVFEKAGSIDVQLNVQAMGAMPQGHGKN